MMSVFVKSFAEPPFSVKEIMRYAGCFAHDSETLDLVQAVIEESRDAFTYKVCYTTLPVTLKGDVIDLGAFSLSSKKLAENLKNAREVLLFAATVGVGIDRLIGKYSRISPSRALLFQALGSERVEALCDAFCKSFEKPLCSRFSPGYGDLTLDCQREIFSLLNCPKNIGLTLNSSMLMSPTKSVTAFAGIK